MLGTDTAAALRTARTQEFDEAVVSEFVQAAEEGLIETMNVTDTAGAREDSVRRGAS